MRTRKPPTDPGTPLSTATTIPIRATADARNPTADPPVRIPRRAAHESVPTGLLLFLLFTACDGGLHPTHPWSSPIPTPSRP